MAAITYSTALKTTALDRVESTTDDKFMDPNESGARVRQTEINFVASGAVSAPVIIGKFDKPVKILEIVLLADDAVADFDLGITPQSAPVDTDSSLGNALALVADTVLRPPLAVNHAVDVPSLIYVNPQTGDLADASTLKGYILYVDNT